LFCTGKVRDPRYSKSWRLGGFSAAQRSGSGPAPARSRNA